MASADSSSDDKTKVFLEGDEEIRGQKYVCLSFLTPNRGILRNKDLFFFSKFLEFYEMHHRIDATESFLMKTFNTMQGALSDVEMDLRNAEFTDLSGAHDVLVQLSDKIKKHRADISRKTTGDLEAHVKENLSDFRETAIVDSFEKYMFKNRQRLEDEFHKQKDFQTTMHGLKVRGVYSNQEQANARAKALNKKDPYFNVYVADVGEWLPWDPDPEEVKDQEYQSDDLNKLMRAYRENAEKRDEFFEEEKRQKVAAAAAAVKEAKEAKGAIPTRPKAVFGVQDAEGTPGDIFSTTGAPDLAMARKQEAAAASTIQHA